MKNGPISTLNDAQYLSDQTGFVYLEENTGNTNNDSFLQDNSVESGDTCNNVTGYTSQIDSTSLKDFDFVKVPTTVIVQNSVESLSSPNNISNIAQPANLNPNVPEFVPTFAHGSCAESLNYDNPLEKNSDIEGMYIKYSNFFLIKGKVILQNNPDPCTQTRFYSNIYLRN